MEFILWQRKYRGKCSQENTRKVEDGKEKQVEAVQKPQTPNPNLFTSNCKHGSMQLYHLIQL